MQLLPGCMFHEHDILRLRVRSLNHIRTHRLFLELFINPVYILLGIIYNTIKFSPRAFYILRYLLLLLLLDCGCLRNL